MLKTEGSREDKAQTTIPIVKTNFPLNVNESKTRGNFPMRTITLQGVAARENQREGLSKRLTDAEF